MRKSKYTDEQIIGFLKQAEAGMSVVELCCREGFSAATFYKWRSKYGGMEVQEAKRLKELEAENGVNHKRVYRIYRAANLSVRKRRRAKRPTSERVPLQPAMNVNEVWSMDLGV